MIGQVTWVRRRASVKSKAQNLVSEEPFRFHKKPWCNKDPSSTFECNLACRTRQSSNIFKDMTSRCPLSWWIPNYVKSFRAEIFPEYSCTIDKSSQCYTTKTNRRASSQTFAGKTNRNPWNSTGKFPRFASLNHDNLIEAAMYRGAVAGHITFHSLVLCSVTFSQFNWSTEWNLKGKKEKCNLFGSNLTYTSSVDDVLLVVVETLLQPDKWKSGPLDWPLAPEKNISRCKNLLNLEVKLV